MFFVFSKTGGADSKYAVGRIYVAEGPCQVTPIDVGTQMVCIGICAFTWACCSGARLELS